MPSLFNNPKRTLRWKPGYTLPFVPEQLANLIFEFDVNKSNKWQDSGRTTPATAAGDAVYVWDNNLGTNPTNAIRHSTSGKLFDAGGGKLYMGSPSDSNGVLFDITWGTDPFTRDGMNKTINYEAW